MRVELLLRNTLHSCNDHVAEVNTLERHVTWRPDEVQEAESRWRVPTEDFDAASGLELAVRDAKAVTSWCMDHTNNVLWTGETPSGPATKTIIRLYVGLTVWRAAWCAF
jgi:hypothetical protein